MKKALQISKLDVAKRQIETAIRLYFFAGDPVSLHTLTAAAYNVVRDVNTKRGGDPMLFKDQIFDYIKPEYEKMLRKKINEAENFFKHADRDHEATLEFNPDQTEIMMLDVCIQYYKLTGESPPLFVAFRMWFMANNQALFDLPEDKKGLLGANAPELAAMGRQGFFNMVIPLLMQMEV